MTERWALLSLDCARFFPLSRRPLDVVERGVYVKRGRMRWLRGRLLYRSSERVGTAGSGEEERSHHVLVPRQKLNSPRSRVRAEGHGHCHRSVAI